MDGGARSKKRWGRACAAGVVLAGLLLAAKGGGQAQGSGMPFRLGRVQVEELQVSVREVGMVDPFSKVEVKSAVSGRVVAIAVREGAQVRRGQVLAEVEPDVNQAQALSEVQAGLSRARVDFLNADKDYAQHAGLHCQGVVSEQSYRRVKVERDLKEETLKAALTRYQVVEDRGIPISGNASTQLARISSPMDGVVIKKGVEPGDTITSGVSSYNAGTVIVTVADLKSMIVRVTAPRWCSDWTRSP